LTHNGKQCHPRQQQQQQQRQLDQISDGIYSKMMTTAQVTMTRCHQMVTVVMMTAEVTTLDGGWQREIDKPPGRQQQQQLQLLVGVVDGRAWRPSC
jgi:hypothetical protein